MQTVPCNAVYYISSDEVTIFQNEKETDNRSTVNYLFRCFRSNVVDVIISMQRC